jgi:type I protein arginine methyltransferase
MYDQANLKILEYHRSMLQDLERVNQFRQAIASALQPGDVVLDVGSGTGLLSFLALQCGAARAYAVETGPVIELARRVATANGYADRIVFLHDQSTKITLPEKVDVIVSETIGNFGLDEGIVEWVTDAATRHLKPGGRLIPQSLRLFAVPLEVPKLHRRVEEWSTAVCAIDYSGVGQFATNQLHWIKFASDSTLSEPQPWANVLLREATKDAASGDASFTCTRDGTLHGIGGWFEAELTPGVSLSNSPSSQTTSWSRALLLLGKPVTVRIGDRVDVKLSAHANGSLWRWHVRCTRQVEEEQVVLAEFHNNTFEGQLLSAQALHRRAAEYVPALPASGHADRFILSLIDGQTSLGEIARQAVDRFPTRFAGWRDALTRASELAESYRA